MSVVTPTQTDLDAFEDRGFFTVDGLFSDGECDQHP